MELVLRDEPATSATGERAAARATHIKAKVKAGSLLAARAATEYVYVGRDMRQILVVAGALFATLFALWLLIVVWRVVPLSFY
jgi:hypothetical protein